MYISAIKVNVHSGRYRRRLWMGKYPSLWVKFIFLIDVMYPHSISLQIATLVEAC